MNKIAPLILALLLVVAIAQVWSSRSTGVRTDVGQVSESDLQEPTTTAAPDRTFLTLAPLPEGETSTTRRRTVAGPTTSDPNATSTASSASSTASSSSTTHSGSTTSTTSGETSSTSRRTSTTEGSSTTRSSTTLESTTAPPATTSPPASTAPDPGSNDGNQPIVGG